MLTKVVETTLLFANNTAEILYERNKNNIISTFVKRTTVKHTRSMSKTVVYLNREVTPSKDGVNKFPRVSDPHALENMQSLFIDFFNKYICFYNMFNFRGS